MKRFVVLLVIFWISTLALPVALMAQNRAVDNLFDKYKGQEGVTTVQVSPELFKMVKSMQIKEIEDHDLPLDKISSVKILTIEDEEEWKGVNFYTEIRDELHLADFEEVMTVEDGDETVRMWMKLDNGLMSEFLLIVGGGDNVLIHITGNFTMRDLQGLAGSFGTEVDVAL